MAQRTCTVEGCDKPYSANGLCGMHAWRLRTHGQLELPEHPARTCAVDGCGKPWFSRDWCAMHNSRVTRHGDPLYEAPPRRRFCPVDECGLPATAHGLCSKHAQRLSSGADPAAPTVYDMTAEQRFLVKVDKNGPIPVLRAELGRCWAWTACISSLGYGIFSTGGKGNTCPAHVWSYENFVDAVPEGLELDHLCRNRACCNPDHLDPVTHAENCRRGVEARRLEAELRKEAS